MKPTSAPVRSVRPRCVAAIGLLLSAVMMAGAIGWGLELRRSDPASRVSVPATAATPEEAVGVVIGSGLVLGIVSVVWALAAVLAIARLGLGLMLLAGSWKTGSGRASGRPLLWTGAILTLLVEGPTLWLSGGQDGWAWFGAIAAVTLLVVLEMTRRRRPDSDGLIKPRWAGHVDLGGLADGWP